MVKIIKTLGTIYLSLILFHTVATKPANELNKTETQAAQQTKGNQEAQETKENVVSDSTNTSTLLADRKQCHANTKSCEDGYSCIRFDYDEEDKYTCVPNNLAFCESNDECKARLGDEYECYLPPWKDSGKKQCFTKHNIGASCRSDSDCINNLICSDYTCIHAKVGNLNEISETFDGEESTGVENILGINKWVFIGAVSFPFVVLLLCIWCWLIGRSSSKSIENKKRERYEKELKEYSLPQNGASSGPLYVNPQKQLEDEVGIRTFRSLFRKKKPEDIQTTNDTNNKDSVDISTTKVGGKAPIDTSTSNETQQKMKKNLSSTNTTSGDTRTSKKGTDTTKTSAKTTTKNTTKNATKNTTKNTTKNAVKSPTPSNATSPALSSPTGKPRATKKKAAGKKKKTTSSNDTNTNSTSSKQSSQRGLVNNASNLSSAMSGQSASYFAGASPIDTQSALYYQQMYGNQAAAQNQYYASYLQNPYYAAAAAQNAAYYGQDPNLMYGAYTNTNYQ